MNINYNNKLDIFKILLSYIDTLHDFSTNKKRLNNLFKFYNEYYFTNNLDILILDKKYNYIRKILQNNGDNVNDKLNRYIILNNIYTSLNNNELIQYHDSNYKTKNYNYNKINKISLSDFKKVLLQNFKFITHNINDLEVLYRMIDYNGSNNLIYNKIKLSNNKELFYLNDNTIELIFYQRDIFYKLIKNIENNNENQTEIILKFILSDNNNDDDNKYYDKYEKLIIKNIFNGLNNDKIQPINFPISYINDTETDNIDGIENIYKFKINNSQKEVIDQAKISTNNNNSETSTNRKNATLDKLIEKQFNTENNKIKENIKIDKSFHNYYEQKYKYNNINKINLELINFNKSLSYMKNDDFEINMSLIKDNNKYTIQLLFIDIKNNIKYSFNYKNDNSITEISNLIDLYISNQYGKIDKYFIIKKDNEPLLIKEFNNELLKIIKKNKKIKEYYNVRNGIMLFIITSFKRFGDWYQQLISQYTYLYIITSDFYAKLFGIINKSPVIINEYKTGEYYLYNFLPNEELASSNEIEFKHSENLIHPKSKFGINNSTDLDENRYYKNKINNHDFYHKYLKYKNKYNKLKNSLT